MCLVTDQGKIKSPRNAYLNTGSFPKNRIWICGVLKKSTFAYLKFNICIPIKFWGTFRFFGYVVQSTSILFAIYHMYELIITLVENIYYFSWLGNNCLKWTWDRMELGSIWLPVSDIVNIQKSHIWIPALLKSHKCIPKAQFFHI